METAEDLEKRLAEEVGSLSTRLVTAVNRQVDLEETNIQLRKQISKLEEMNKSLIKNDESYKIILPKYLKLQDDFKDINIKKEVAESENTKLKGEVEELTASLFDEANTMVSNASRETHNFKIKNRKLYEEIDEKNIIIANLQDQLHDLKQMFIKIEDQQRLMAYTNTGHNTPKMENNMEFPSPGNVTGGDVEGEDHKDKLQLHLQQLADCLYSPQIAAIRFDLNNYNKDFKGFIYNLIKPDFQFDLSHLKNLTFFKNIWTYEIETAVGYIPPLPQTSILNRWQKGKIFWNSLVDGRISIEPIKGFHERKLNLASSHNGPLNKELLSMAIREPCSFCGEFRDEAYEHCRFHTCKIYDVDETVIAQYPLCNYCVIKLRNLCDFFAKIRLIRSNIFKLHPNAAFEEYGGTGTGSSTFYKRTNSSLSTTASTFAAMTSASSASSSSAAAKAENQNTSSSPNSSGYGYGSGSGSGNNNPHGTDNDLMNGHVHGIDLDVAEESKLIKIYLMLTLIRLKIFWGRLGVWDNVDQINEVNLDEVNHELFIHLIPASKRKKLVQDSLPNSPRQGTVRESFDKSHTKTVKEQKTLAIDGADSKITSTIINDDNSDQNPSDHNNQLAQLNEGQNDSAPLENSIDQTEDQTTIDDHDIPGSFIFDSAPNNDFDNLTVTGVVNLSINADEDKDTKDEGEKITGGIENEEDHVKAPKLRIPIEDDEYDDDTGDEEFKDSSNELKSRISSRGATPNNANALTITAEKDSGLKRSKSKSKQFKEKIDKDLNQTLEMLAENMEDIQ